MGLLTNAGYPIAWDSEENKAAVKYVLEHGIEQFLALYSNYRGEKGRPFLWGDEVEYQLVQLDEEKGSAKLWLHASDPLDQLNKMEEEAKEDKTGKVLDGLWRPEYASYMIEGTPAKPYTHELASIASCEASLIKRRKMLQKFLPKNVVPLTLVNFPRMGSIDPKTGIADFTTPAGVPKGPASHSLFVPDNCINPHPRFGTLTANIRKRRNKKVSIRVPLFMDERTRVDPFLNIDSNVQNKHLTSTTPMDDDDDDDLEEAPAKKRKVDSSTKDDLKPNVTPTMYYFAQYFDKEESKDIVASKHNESAAAHPSIYMDCMAFGMGCNCLQTTFQARELDQARHVYDQLAVLCPIMLAISAATPIHKGLLSEIDVRWMVISESVDDRTDEEVPRIMKSRYDSVSTYISTRPADNYFAKMNDINLCVDEGVYKRLRESEIDHRLARHVSHLFIRDPLVIYSGRLHQLEDATSSDHFENIQSTNWQSMRFKPPPPMAAGSDIGWRVEFRSMDAQFSSFENAAYMVFTILLARAIIAFDLDFYIPLTKVDTNTARAHIKDAVRDKKFIMQKNIGKLDILKDPSTVEYCEMSVDEIFNGCEHFEGLIPVVKRYLQLAKEEEHDGKSPEDQAKWVAAEKRVNAYLELLKRRANGSLLTTAQYLRKFVTTHPTYQKDSKVTPEIAYDVCTVCDQIASGKLYPEELLPEEIVKMAGEVLN
eukprot:TRINITY_DN37667_c0_g1_i1.p1 TRINITY_DN37667_c0_g1~~TRINITY_DN37667_c0_g1_i1.p1  ORF type:complete len:710 (+),score=211.80 TRINITY_DN37667_c0_g1_i1:64-2193(+)